jgi:hypothetical protein
MYIFKEGDSFIVYCPALDLSSYGDTENEAKAAFKKVFEETVKYMLNKNTLKEDLIKHGWEVKSLKQKKLKSIIYYLCGIMNPFVARDEN